MKHGKIITVESYFDGVPKLKKVVHEESIEIRDKEHLLKEVLEGLDLALADSDDVNLSIRRNSDGKLRLVKTHRVS